LNLPDYVISLGSASFSPTSGSANITTGAGTESITLVGVDHDNPVGAIADDFGIAVANDLAVGIGAAIKSMIHGTTQK
jgi:hypothetical protein